MDFDSVKEMNEFTEIELDMSSDYVAVSAVYAKISPLKEKVARLKSTNVLPSGDCADFQEALDVLVKVPVKRNVMIIWLINDK